MNEFDPSKPVPVPERKQHYEPTRGPRPDYGYIGIQNHDANSVVYFKEVSVIESSKTNLTWLWETRYDLRNSFVKYGPVPTPVDIYQMLLAIPAHNERHLQQIAEIKASPNYPKR